MSANRDRQLKVAILPYTPGMSPIASPSPMVFAARRTSSIRRVSGSPSFRAARKRVRPLPPLPRAVPVVVNKELSPRPLPSPPTPTPTGTAPKPATIRTSLVPDEPVIAPRRSDVALDSDTTKRSSMLLPDLLSTSITPGQAAVPRRRSRRRPTELRIQTLRTNLSPAPSLRRADTSHLSPLTPSIPQCPSPVTTKRKRIAKLRRHLGESIPPELVFSGSKPTNNNNVKSDQRETIWASDVPGQLHVRIQKVKVIVRDDDDHHHNGGGGGGGGSRVVTDETVSRPNGMNRFSRKWLQERAGRRWVENDYQKILQALRAL